MTKDKALEAARAAYEHHQDVAMDQQHSSISAYIDALENAFDAMQAQTEAAEAKWIAADEGEKLNAEFLAVADKRAEAADARVKELEGAFQVNVTDQELVRLNNMAVGTDEVTISSRMMLTLVGCIIAARTALTGGSNG